MDEKVDIYVREVFWKSVYADVNNQVYSIELCNWQPDFDSQIVLEHEILHCYITYRVDPVRDCTSYRIDIDHLDIVIWDKYSLTKIEQKTERYQPRYESEKFERYEILDIRQEGE